MKLRSLFLALIALGAAAQVHAAGFQAAAWAPDAQLVPASEDISGVRLSIYGENANVTGWDVGIANFTKGDFKGVALTPFIGVYHQVGGDMRGAQFAWVTNTQGSTFGLQWGLVNLSKDLHGVQIGFVNYTETIRGLQIGLWNQVDSRGWGEFAPLPKVFPFINLGF